MNEKEIIEEMAKEIEKAKQNIWAGVRTRAEDEDYLWHSRAIAEHLMLQGYTKNKISEGAVVLTKEEYEKLKSLYDCDGAYMTSQIGDLPLTVEGLRKAVDEITRLNRVEAELQELNAKYYNEAKDLRRKVNRLEAHAKINDEHLHIRIKEQARKETAERIFVKVINELMTKKERAKRFYSIKESTGVDMAIKKVKEIAKQYGVEE